MARNPLRPERLFGWVSDILHRPRLSREPQGVYNAAWPQAMRPPTIKDPPMTERYHLISSVT